MKPDFLPAGLARQDGVPIGNGAMCTSAPGAETDRLITEIANVLQRTGECRVLRRLRPRECYEVLPADAPERIGLVVDTETTGLDVAHDEIIELAMVRFSYGAGRVGRILGTFAGFNQPSAPIPAAVTALTGIDDASVSGHRLDAAAVEEFASGVHVVIAHHAGFDRPMVERHWPTFAGRNWACTATEIGWKGEGLESARLGQILAAAGYFHDAHRALDDCLALVEILSRPLPRSGTIALGALLERARRPTVRVRAERAPFESRHALKARQYRWHDGRDGKPRCWFVDVDEAALDAEIRYLRQEIYRRDVDPPTTRLTSLDRFSVRC